MCTSYIEKCYCKRCLQLKKILSRKYTKREWQQIANKVVLGMFGEERYKEEGEKAYNIALVKFTPQQLGALHRKLAYIAREEYYKEAI